MAKFQADSSVEALEYDFTAYGGSAGVIPEPSNQALKLFMDNISQLQSVVGKVDAEDANVSEQFSAATDGMVNAIVALTQNSIPRGDLEKLPYRVLQAFVGWLASQINPEA